MQIIVRYSLQLGVHVITGAAGYCKDTGCDRGCWLSEGTGHNWGVQVIVRVQVVTGCRLIG